MAEDDNVIPLKSVPDPEWMARLARNANGIPHPTLANALILMKYDSAFQGMLGYDSFTGKGVLMRAPMAADKGDVELPGPYPRPWGNSDISLITAYMQRVWHWKFSRPVISDAIEATAMRTIFHPVTDWLDTLTWDGKPRLDHWLMNAFDPVLPEFDPGSDKEGEAKRNAPVLPEFDPGSDKEGEAKRNAKLAYYKAIGSKILIAAVRRVRRPGCKFDSLLILEGPQRIGKSTALLTLFGRKWFSDAVPPDLKNRDAAIALQGLWCLEFAEIEHLVRTEIETIKAFLSRSEDHYRPVHGRDFVDVPRQAVLIGTTNSDDYLRDPTGNSRMWPVPCRRVDLKWLELNRDQLWAEAARREASGEDVWLTDEALQIEAAASTAERMSDEVWEPAILNWLANPETNMAAPITTARILSEAVDMSKDKMTKAASMRIAAVMRAAGWTRHVERDQRGKSRRVWRMPDAPVVSTTSDDFF